MNTNDRLTLLERETRRWRTAVALLGIGLGLCLFLGQAKPEATEVKATKFVLVDEQGAPRGTLAMENGGPAFVLTDSKGKGVIRLQVPKVPDKAALYLSDPIESTDAELAMTQTGPVLHFNDRVGNRIRLATNELNAPLAAVYDAEGKKVFEVTGKK
ncbi:MAG: hypothetical protein IAF94_09965 [Pirellulaceae bacterium]|nr:hypothetical protein [Pirellulaceae bacterium]